MSPPPQPDPDEELTPEQQEALEAFERGIREFATRPIGEVLPPVEEMIPMVEEQMRGRIREGLRQRGIPEEWWEHRLIEIEAEVTEVGDVLGFQVMIPEDLQRWMQRRPVRYDPGRPPV